MYYIFSYTLLKKYTCHTCYIDEQEKDLINEFVDGKTKPFGVQTFRTPYNLSKTVNTSFAKGKLFSELIPLFMQQIDRFIYICQNPGKVSASERQLVEYQLDYLFAKSEEDQQYICLYLINCYLIWSVLYSIN